MSCIDTQNGPFLLLLHLKTSFVKSARSVADACVKLATYFSHPAWLWWPVATLSDVGDGNTF